MRVTLARCLPPGKTALLRPRPPVSHRLLFPFFALPYLRCGVCSYPSLYGDGADDDARRTEPVEWPAGCGGTL